MANRKKEINFLEAQKLMGKTKQSTSFEFILVVTTVVVACAMGVWIYFASQGAKEAATQLEQAQTEEANLQAEIRRLRQEFENYTENGQGGYLSIREVADQIRLELDAAQAAAGNIQGTVDLTSTVIKIALLGAQQYELTVAGFSYSGGTFTIRITTSHISARGNYYQYLMGQSKDNLPFDPSKYIGNIRYNYSQITSEGNSMTTYAATFSFNIISDALYEG